MKRTLRNIGIISLSIFLVICLSGGVYIQNIFNGMTVEASPSTVVSTNVSENIGDLNDYTVIATEELNDETEQYENWDFGSNYINVLAVGIDARDINGSGLTDVLMICSFDMEAKTIRLVSIMRDTYVQVAGYSGSTKINSVFAAYGGIDTLMKTINTRFGTNLTKYAIVNFYNLATIIDRVGGIDIHVETKEEMDQINGLQFEIYKTDTQYLTEYGDVHLTGQQAVAYARIRKIGNGDQQRTERQRQVMLGIYNAVKTSGILQWPAIFNDCKDLVRTNMTADEILAAGVKVLSAKNAGMEQLRVPMDGAYNYQTINGLSCVVPNLSECSKAISLFLQGNYVPPKQ